MSTILPKPPSGTGPFAQWAKEVCEVLERIQPRPGQNVSMQITTKGTIISVKETKGGSGVHCGPARYS